MKYEQIKNILVTTGYTQQGYKDQILEYINKLQRENKILKENAKNNDKIVDKVNWENLLLKKENKQLKMINKEYERLNKENGRGFKITNVQEYDIYELLSYKNYKDNWNKLKEYLNYKSERAVGEDEYVYDEIYNEMQELEQGSGGNE